MQRSAQASERMTAVRISPGVAGSATHSSSCIWMSAPSRHWISIARSGVRTWVEPSMCDWKVTPASVILRSLERLITWKPPLSVRIGFAPPHEAVQAAQSGHALGARPQHQMIGVGEDHIGARTLELVGVDGLYGCRRSDRHECRCANDAAGRGDLAEARAGVRRHQAKAEILSHRIPGREPARRVPACRATDDSGCSRA